MPRLLILGAAVLALAATPAAHAGDPDSFPTRALRIVVPLATGGPSDFIARQVAQQMSASLGQPVVVENKPGADGMIAAREVASAPADGHTLLYAPASMIAAPLMTRTPAFEWAREFAPLGEVARVTFGLAVHPDVPARTVAELVAHARSHPTELNVATSTPSELMAVAEFMKAAGVSLTRVPYKGGAQALQDLLAGRVQLMFGPIALVQPYVRSGGLRMLATVAPQRSATLPDVPTMSEAGYAGVTVPTWQALYTSARVPPAIRARLAAEVAAAIAKPELHAEFDRRALTVEGASPRDLAATIAREQVAWSALIAQYRLGAD